MMTLSKSLLLLLFFETFAVLIPTLLSNDDSDVEQIATAHKPISITDDDEQIAEEYKPVANGDETLAKVTAEEAFHHDPEEVMDHFNLNVHKFMTGSNGTSRRNLGNKKNDGPCMATNPIDQCWRCDSNWAQNRKKLAGCILGFGKKTTGGKNGNFYVVTNCTDHNVNDPTPGTLRHAVTRDGPLWITFKTDMVITLQQELMISSDKTIDGRGHNIHIAFGAGLSLHYVNNVIIHNLHIHDLLEKNGGTIKKSETKSDIRTKSDGDGINLFGATNVWIDHCSIYKCVDGLIDAIKGTTGVTISNCHFTWHNDVMLFGASDSHTEDEKMQITIAFNHFGKGLVQRMPRVRFGYIHIVNNQYTSWLMYAIGGSKHPTIISQGNKFDALVAKSNNSCEVTKRDTEPKTQWKDWNWRSEKDHLLNCAFFVESGSSNYQKRENMIPPQPGTSASHMTKYSGTLQCFEGKPC